MELPPQTGPGGRRRRHPQCGGAPARSSAPSPRPSIAEALTDAIGSAALGPHLKAAVALARRLADELDAAKEAKEVVALSGRLLDVLGSLGMTRAVPASAAVPGVEGGVADAAVASLSRLRDRAKARRPV